MLSQLTKPSDYGRFMRNASAILGFDARSELYVYEGLGHGAYEEAGDFYERVMEYCSR